jgi:hypothetical protein
MCVGAFAPHPSYHVPHHHHLSLCASTFASGADTLVEVEAVIEGYDAQIAQLAVNNQLIQEYNARKADVRSVPACLSRA